MIEQFIDFLKESFPKSRLKDELSSYLQRVYLDVASDEGYLVPISEKNTDGSYTDRLKVVCLVPDDDDLTIFGYSFLCPIDGEYIHISIAIGHFIPNLKHPTLFKGAKCLAKFLYNADDQTLYDIELDWHPINCI